MLRPKRACSRQKAGRFSKNSPTTDPLTKQLQFVCRLLAVVLLSYGTYLAWQRVDLKQMFPFKQVQVETTATQINAHHVAEVVANNLQGGFFSFNVEALNSQLLEDPWVDEVAFRRLWPGTLKVYVKEKKALALWQENQVISSRGDLFLPLAEKLPKHLPRLSGPDEQLTNVLQEYHKIQGQLAKKKLQLTFLALSPEATWRATINHRFYLTLGGEALEAKIKRFLALYRTMARDYPDKAIAVDLRYANGAAVKPMPPEG